jgi:hypothetical protein
MNQFLRQPGESVLHHAHAGGGLQFLGNQCDRLRPQRADWRRIQADLVPQHRLAVTQLQQRVQRIGYHVA